MASRDRAAREKAPGVRVGTVAGVPVFIGWSWLLLAAVITALVGPSITQQRPDLGVRAYGVGLLVALGTAADRGLGDLARTMRDAVAEPFTRRGTTAWEPATTKRSATLGWQQTRVALNRMLPGVEFRRVPGWRYLATWQRPGHHRLPPG